MNDDESYYPDETYSQNESYTRPDQNYYPNSQNFCAVLPDQNYHPNNYSQDYYYCYTNDYNNPENNQSSHTAVYYHPEPIISSDINKSDLKTPEPEPVRLTQPISRPPPSNILDRPVEKRVTDDVLFTAMVNDITRLKFKKWKLLYYDNAKTQWDNYLEWATYKKNLRVCSQIYELPNWTDNIFYLTDEQYTAAISTKGRDFSLSQLFLLAKLQDRRRRKAGRGKSLSMRYQFPQYVYTMSSREILEKFVNNNGPVVTFEYLQHATTNDFLALVKNVDDCFKKSLIRFVRTRAKHKLKIDNFE